MMTRAQIIRQAYAFYPKGINDGDPEYIKSDQQKLLRKKRKEIPRFIKVWEDFVCEINKSIPIEVKSIEDWSDTISVNNSLRLIVNHEKIKIVLEVSILIPFYIIYSSKFAFEESETDLKNGISIVNYLKAILANYFVGYKQMSMESADVEIDNISSNGIGILNYYNETHGLRKMTVFNAFFANSFL